MHLYKYLIIQFCIIGQITTYSQINRAKDLPISFSSVAMKISYSPTEIISNISLSAKKFENGKEGIEFIFKATNKEPYDNINPDKIELQSLGNRTLIINAPVYDTIYFDMDGILSLNSIHYLNDNEKKFMKEETIQYIIITANNVAFKIIIAKKSQRAIKEFSNRYYN